MAYGDSTAKAARFGNQPTRGETALDRVLNEGDAAEKELYGGPAPSAPAMPKDMQIIQGVTDDIYKQYSAAEDFAQTMWHNYRIDVTKPDVRNPLAMKAHDMYQQAISGVMYAGDVLKQSNELLAKDREAAREGKGVVLQDPSQNVYGTGVSEDSRFVNTQLDSRAGQSNNAYAKSYDTRVAAQTANQNVETNKKSTADMYRQMGMENRANVVEGQFENGVYDAPQFNPNTGRGRGGLTPEIAKNIYDQITNYKIGILNNDKGTIGAIKNNFPGILDVRPVNTATKQGAYITRKAGDQTVTSFVDFSNEDPTQGREALFYTLQTANPAKFKVDANEMVPYLQQTTEEGYNQGNTQGAVNQFHRIFSTSNDKTNPEAKGMAEQLDKLAVTGQLRLPSGHQIIDVEWKDTNPWYKTNRQRLVIHTLNDSEPIELDPTKPEDQKLFGDIIDYNSGELLPQEEWDKVKTSYINSEKINPNKGSKIDIPSQAQKSPELLEYERMKKSRKQ